jgi:hypothetical protein
VNGVLPQSDLGDIRILLDTPANAAWFRAPLVGGDGCAIDNRPANWGVIANEPVLSKWCHFNMKLSDVMLPGTREYALNLTLHEFGHRLGLEHEHDRADAPCFKGQMANSAPVTMADVRGTAITSGPMLFMTAFDRRSVMMYTLPACEAPGSVAATGFSDLDRLALRILYPERVRVAEVAGVRVVSVGTSIALDSLWKTLGAVVTETGPSVAAKFEWTVDGTRRATTSGLTMTLGEGRHRVQYAFEDFRGRSYSSDTTVEVLSAAQFTRRMASQAALNGMQ